MKILFVMLNGGYVRNYDGVLRQLAAQGHRIHIAIELDRNKMNENVLGQRLVAETSNVTFGLAAVPEDTRWYRAARSGRLLVDYLRYLAPQYRDATALRSRAFALLHERFRPLVRAIGHLGSPVAAAVIRLLVAAERAAPLSRTVTAFLEEQQPDVLLLTPLVEPGSIQVDYIKSARPLGIPTALCVASWDNLTNKGAMRVVPDRVFVWNEPQRDEAVTLHGVPAERVTVTGAQMFDHWFAWKPSRTREAFCSGLGLDPAHPFVLYLGSSFFIAPTEAEFGGRWLAALRDASDPVVSQAGVLIRPHPNSGGQWQGVDLSRWHHATVWPPFGVDMFAPEFKYDFFDSLYHCSAVVGVNTSAQIEAAIVGKTVCTVEAVDFQHSQRGTLHFQHLVKGGLLQVAQTLDEHVADLGAILRDPEAQAERSRAFVEYFVRPFGRDVAATPRLAAAIVDLAATPKAKHAPSPLARIFQVLLLPLVYYAAWLPARRPFLAYAMRPAIGLWVYVRLRPHRLAQREREKAAAAKRLEKERGRTLSPADQVTIGPRPLWAGALRVAVDAWVYFRVRPYVRAERTRQERRRVMERRRQQRAIGQAARQSGIFALDARRTRQRLARSIREVRKRTALVVKRVRKQRALLAHRRRKRLARRADASAPKSTPASTPASSSAVSQLTVPRPARPANSTFLSTSNDAVVRSPAGSAPEDATDNQ